MNAVRAALTVLAVGLAGGRAHADSWCARPLIIHEWGVYVIGDDPQKHLAEWPDWLYTPERLRQSPTRVPARLLPADMGVRRLPVLFFYGGVGTGSTIPVGVEVGFTWGSPFVWYPRVDVVKPASRQLVWDRLDLASQPALAPRATGVAWVQQARSIENALWVDGPDESERFVFYEATSRQEGALVLTRAPSVRADRREFRLENRSAFAVHDVFVVHRDPASARKPQAFLFSAPSIAAHGALTFVLEDHPTSDARAAGLERLRARLVAPADPPASAPGDCMMNRNPAVPFDKAVDYHLYSAEFDLLASVWAARFFDQPGTTLIYREDAAQLDAIMPLAIYTDMFHFVRLARTGFVVQR